MHVKTAFYIAESATTIRDKISPEMLLGITHRKEFLWENIANTKFIGKIGMDRTSLAVVFKQIRSPR